MKAWFRSALGIALIMAISACGGSGGNNQQGVSFSFLGFYETAPVSADEELGPPFVATEYFVGGSEDDGFSGLESPAMFGCALNNLNGQFIRVDRAFYEFNSPGAGISIPSTSTATNMFLGPADGGGSAGAAAGFDSTLPDSFAGDSAPKSRNCGRLLKVPPSVAQFLALNKGNFAEETFEVEMKVTLSGVTSSGDRITSNPMSFLLLVTTGTPITPTDGSDTGGDAAA